MKNLVQRLTSRLDGEVCYWLCELLCGRVARRTSCEKLNAAAAIATVQTLNVARLLETPEDRLPSLIRNSLPAFTTAEWQEVLALAKSDRDYIEDGLQRHPEWAHLRRESIK